MGAASPNEIAERLRAEGFVLVGPLHRNDTVYLADVNAGPAGRERLVIDAWSGEILQRFVPRNPNSRPGAAGGYVIERGEFDIPPPLAPPPARDFFVGPGGSGNLAYGGPGNARIPEAVGPINPLERNSKNEGQAETRDKQACARRVETDDGGGAACSTAEAGRRRRQPDGERQFGKKRGAGCGRTDSGAACGVRGVTAAEHSAEARHSAGRIDAVRDAGSNQERGAQSWGNGDIAKHGPDSSQGRTPPGSIRAACRRSFRACSQTERQVEGQRRAGQPHRITNIRAPFRGALMLTG